MFRAKDLQKYFDKSSSPHIGFKGSCHDCGKPVCIKMDMDAKGKVVAKGGALYDAQIGQTQEDRKFFMKCDSCFKKDPVLRNFQPCEVWSRSIGYLRPVADYNDGKKAEFAMRSKFKIE